MGSKGVLSSAAAGGSLIAASVVLVIGVSALIGFRGFDTARTMSERQSIVLERRAADREAGTTARPATAVIGAAARRTTRRSAETTPRRKARTARRKAPARGGLSAPARKRTAQARPTAAAVPAATQAPAAQDSDSQRELPAPEPAPLSPVDRVVEDVTGTVGEVADGTAQSVGDVLLDLRDALP